MTPNDRAAMDDARPTRAEAILKAGQDWLFHDDQNRFVREVLKALSRPESPVARSVAGEAVAIVTSNNIPGERMHLLRSSEDRPTLDVGTKLYAAPQPSSQAVDARRDALEEAAKRMESLAETFKYSNPHAVTYRDAAREIRALAPQPTERPRSTVVTNPTPVAYWP